MLLLALLGLEASQFEICGAGICMEFFLRYHQYICILGPTNDGRLVSKFFQDHKLKQLRMQET